MNVPTSNDVALIGCCPCQPDACEPPRVDCQSITVAACGYSLPALSTVPAEDRCKIFRKREEKVRRVSAITTDDGAGATSTDDEDETTIATYQNDYVTVGTGEEAVRTCTTRQFSTSYSFTDDQTETFTDEGEDPVTTTSNYTSSSSSGVDSPCSGSFSYTATGDPGDSGDYDVCPIPFAGTPTVDWIYTTLGVFSTSGTTVLGDTPLYDGTQTDTNTVSYLEQVTIASLEAEIEVRKTMLAGDDWPGTACTSSVSYTYGTEDPPDPLPDPAPELAIVCEQVSSITKARYRVGIPASERWEATTAEWLAWEEGGSIGTEPLKTTQDAAHAAWVIAHAAWTAADSAERGEEPLEPTPRSTYELQWDEVFFPTDELTPPSLVASRSWVYAADEWSSWFEIAVPTEPGETRVANMLVICYRSAALGQKPTAHGEVYEL